MTTKFSLEQLISEGAEALANKKKANKSVAKKKGKQLNPYRSTELTESPSGKFTITEVDTRMSDPYWSDIFRVLLLREVTCRCCGIIQQAPNELLMMEKAHPIHGSVMEAIGINDSKYSNLPLRTEVHKAEIPLCQHCIVEEDLTGSALANPSQTAFDFTEASNSSLLELFSEAEEAQ